MMVCRCEVSSQLQPKFQMDFRKSQPCCDPAFPLVYAMLGHAVQHSLPDTGQLKTLREEKYKQICNGPTPGLCIQLPEL